MKINYLIFLIILLNYYCSVGNSSSSSGGGGGGGGLNYLLIAADEDDDVPTNSQPSLNSTQPSNVEFEPEISYTATPRLSNVVGVNVPVNQHPISNQIPNWYTCRHDPCNSRFSDTGYRNKHEKRLELHQNRCTPNCHVCYYFNQPINFKKPYIVPSELRNNQVQRSEEEIIMGFIRDGELQIQREIEFQNQRREEEYVEEEAEVTEVQIKKCIHWNCNASLTISNWQRHIKLVRHTHGDLQIEEHERCPGCNKAANLVVNANNRDISNNLSRISTDHLSIKTVACMKLIHGIVDSKWKNFKNTMKLSSDFTLYHIKKECRKA
ncbi:hypothetical protein RB653_004965 [Dictyostelium firmibasis]|uniref:C2H2-type domain-containing protein n=1 Tax=Dictyostelium firmibasis TaxID=79012 RepID=A0AAN7Z0L1_9MYCE